MTPQRRQRVKDAFFALCDAPAAERERLLDHHCGNDAELRAAVEALLRDDPGDGAPDFISPVNAAALVGALPADDPADYEPVGELAHCRIHRKVGEGGMGAVYECEQQTPRRRVAIKLVRHGLTTPAVLRRFRHEAEILARLKHPNIARVFEAGVTPVSYRNGTSAHSAFMMMEFVDGLPLTAVARERNLSTRERLELVITLCDAVRHAHATGIIHRDLKPANILVEEEVGKRRSDEETKWNDDLTLSVRADTPHATTDHPPTPSLRHTVTSSLLPKILDFGIARMTGPDTPARSLVTAPGQILGTLAYMAPEQILADPNLVDTRSDVYALGVILFELLAGRLPLALDTVSLAEAARIARDVEPPNLATIAPEFRGDLATIVAKALRKTPEDRYQSASDLGADLRRFLDLEPISARPATRTYVFRKFAQRNRGLVVAASAAIAALLLGALGATAGLVSAQRSNTKLQAAIQETNKQLTRSEQVTALMRRMLLSVRPMVARDRDTTIVREVLETTVKQIESGELKNLPEVEAEMRGTIAETYAALGDNKAALETIEKAMVIVRAAPADSPDKGFLRIRRTYASILFDWRRVDEARAEFETVLATRAKHGMPDDDEAAMTLTIYASVIDQQGHPDEALGVKHRILEIRRRIHGENHPTVASTMGNIAGSLQNLKRYDEALEMLLGCLRIHEAQEPPSPLHLTIIKSNLASLLENMDRLDESERYIREAIASGEQIFKPEHQQLGNMRHNLSIILERQDKHQLAYDEATRGLQILRTAFGEKHPRVLSCRHVRANIMASLHRYEEAEAELLAVHALFAPVPPADAPASEYPPADASPDDADQLRLCAQELAKFYTDWNSTSPDPARAAAADVWGERAKPPPKKTP